MSTSKSNDTNDAVILFGDKRPDAIGLSQLYDPDVHGTNVLAAGKIVPAVNSLVTDETTNILYRVKSVDSVTYKSELVPINFLNTEGSDPTVVPAAVKYGNDRFVAYYDDRVKPTSIEIDGKLYILGASKVEYRLLFYNSVSHEDEVISLYLDTDEKFKGNRIPLETIKVSDGIIKRCTNCHTLHPIHDGDIITLQVFNSNGQQTEEYNLVAKRSIIQDDLLSDGNPIVDFDADGTQMMGDEFFLYENQEPTALNLSPFVTYADGATMRIGVDSISCFVYGFEGNNIANYPGKRFKILIKKYLSSRETTVIDTFDKTRRSISCEKWINIVKNGSNYTMKITIIPWYDKYSQEYKFKFFAYTEEREHVYDITDYIEYVTEDFNPKNYDSEQYLRVRFDVNNIWDNNVHTIYQQSWYITLREPSNYISFIIKDTKNDEYAYGAESSVARRPVIHYDTKLKQYFVPTSFFKNKEAFIEAFYTFARPPYDSTTEEGPTEPTHFTIRGLDNANVLITTPIPVEQYHQVWNIVRQGAENQLVGGTVLVEFLKSVGDDEYRILYGVPVQVVESTTGYNTPTNNLR